MGKNKTSRNSMNIRHDIPIFIQYLYALLIAILILLLIAACTNSIPAFSDALYYLNIAKYGLIGNPNLVAPFAYRPGMPFVSSMISTLLCVSIEDGFRIVGWISAIFFLMSIFMLSRYFTTDYRHAIIPMILLGLSFYHIKFPLSFYTLVDVAAYPLMVFSCWALITRRFLLCLLVSSIGVFFKEFLAVPLILLFIQLGCEFLRTRSKLNLLQLSIAIGFGISAILIPRFFIPVSKTFQFVDPLNDLSTLKMLISAPLDELRIFNIIYAVVSYWLPTILLLTRPRFNALWADLQGFNMLVWCGIYLFLVLLLTMYGGTNIPIFISYSVVVQIVVLALLFRHGVGVAETIYVIFVILIYNKILLHIPTPDISFDAYIDFYGGWSSRVSGTTIIRFLECGVFVAISSFIRIVVSKISSNGQQGHAADPLTRAADG